MGRCMMQNDAGVQEEEEEEEEETNTGNKGQSLIMSREAIREAKKRERQAERKKSGKIGKNNSGKKSAGKKIKTTKITFGSTTDPIIVLKDCQSRRRMR